MTAGTDAASIHVAAGPVVRGPLRPGPDDAGFGARARAVARAATAARACLPGRVRHRGATDQSLHIDGLHKMGATIAIEHGYVQATEAPAPRGVDRLPQRTVTGTENLMMAAVLAEGTTHAFQLRPRAGSSTSPTS